jgi:hypothetical protein
MKTKTNIIFIVLISLISLLSLSAFSINEDFIAVAEQGTIDVCQCEIIESTIKIGNTGDINSLYSIAQDGTASKWSVIRPKSFSLEEKKTKELINPINVPCDAKLGKHELITYIETGFGLKKAITQNIVVKKCEKEINNPVIDSKENQTINSNQTSQETEQKQESLVMKILKWIAYISIAFIVIIIIIIVILYRSETNDEPDLEEKNAKPVKKSEKTAAKRKNNAKKGKVNKRSN